MKVRVMNSENTEKRLEANEKILVEKQNRLNDLECENRQHCQQVINLK